MTTQQISEIRVMYRQAADKNKQIGILADLYLTSRAKICEIVGHKQRLSARSPYSMEEINGYLAMLESKSAPEVARIAKVTPQTISNWRRKFSV